MKAPFCQQTSLQSFKIMKNQINLLYLHKPLLTQVLILSERFGEQFLIKSSNVTVARAFMLAATVL